VLSVSLYTTFALARSAPKCQSEITPHLGVIDSTMLNPMKGKTHIVAEMRPIGASIFSASSRLKSSYQM